ncbi:MAG: PfkB family carbohydrate kinase [Candidatus Thiodiazotropha sp.]
MKVLSVGVATLDIIDWVAEYPREDSEQRAEARWSRLGGNSANTLVVLSQLGHACSWAGSLAEDAAAGRIATALEAYAIDMQWARVHPGATSPASHVLQSRRTASRTIVHYRDLPEFEAQDFAPIELAVYDWLHFEGRHVAACERMLRRAAEYRPKLRTSLEVEKPREGIEGLFPLADVLIFSRAYAQAKGYASALELFGSVRALGATGLLFAAWGEEGGWLDQGGGSVIGQPARPPAKLIDTLGAGDVFNAGVIHTLLMGETPRQALAQAVELSGRKCGRQGLDGLVD